MASTLNLFRNGAVGFIDWLGVTPSAPLFLRGPLSHSELLTEGVRILQHWEVSHPWH